MVFNVLSNKVMNVPITPNDLRAYQSLGFDTSSFNEEDEIFSFDTNTPIPMVQYHDSHNWGKYDYKIGDKILIQKDGILRKSRVQNGWTAMEYNDSTYGCNYQDSMRNQIRKINLRRITPFSEEKLMQQCANK